MISKFSKSYLKFICSALILLVFIGSGFVAKAQIINAIAGTTTFGYTGDGGAATAAEIHFPTGLVADTGGNVYFADEYNSCIRKITRAGNIYTVAGNSSFGFSGDGGPSTTASLLYPFSVALDRAGNLYIADAGNNRIRKVTHAGIISTIAGNGTGAYSGDGLAATAAELNDPTGVAVDAYGNVYIADQDNARIRMVNTAGIISTIAGTGTVGYSGDGGPATGALFEKPIGLAVDAATNIYVVDYVGNCIRKFSPGGIINTFAGGASGGFGGDGGPATAAQLAYPEGVAVDASGNVYIADDINQRVRKVDLSGTIRTVAGDGTGAYGGDGGPATAAELWAPYGVATDLSGNLYIADGQNSRIRKVTCPLPVVGYITGTVLFCTGSVGALYDTTPGGTWVSGNPSVVAIGSAGAISGLTSGSSSITYSVENSCGIASVFGIVTVDTFPSAGSISGIDSVCPGDTVTLASTGVGGIWLSSKTSLATVSGGSVIGVAGGRDTILYVSNNICGSDTAIFPVKVRTQAVCTNGLGNPGTAEPGLSVFPNPGHGFITISVQSGAQEDVQVVVANVLGKKVKEYKIPTNKETDIQLNIPPGVYFLSASAHGMRETTKLVVE